MRRVVVVVLVAGLGAGVGVVGCGETATIDDPVDAQADALADTGADTGDPCSGKALPECPAKCTTFPMTGACTSGDACAMNEIGDACACVGGAWQCTVHPPLGQGCNLVCRGFAPPKDAGADGPSADASDGAAVCDATVKGACGANAYCLSKDCKTGVCVPLPTETKNTFDPVCGCDDVNYWNDDVAGARGMSVKAKGECAKPVTCGGPGPTRACPAGLGLSCDMMAGNAVQCAAQSVPGVCWALPKTCPTIVIGPDTRGCGQVRCASRCDLVRAEATYYRDVTCPQ